jgi:hypothetical protein
LKACTTTKIDLNKRINSTRVNSLLRRRKSRSAYLLPIDNGTVVLEV